MTRFFRYRLAPGALALGLLLAGGARSHAQKAIPVPNLDLNKLTGTWFEIAKLPAGSEKRCLSDETILYALNDKKATFQVGTFCLVKGGDHINSNNTGRMSKTRDGKLQLRHWVLFHRPYWVLATAPDYEWALVGSPNHKSLWMLSREAEISPELYAQLEGTARAQGFPVEKLVRAVQPKDRVTLASPSANPRQIESPSPTPTKPMSSSTPQ